MADKSEGICQRTTQGQVKFYVEFCKKHPEISKKYSERYGKIAPLHVRELWSQLAEKLNEMRGPTRTVKKWKESFTIWRSMVRYRARNYTPKTGIGCRYENLLKFMESKNPEKDEVPIKKIRQIEMPPNVHHATEVNKATSDVEFPFDSIFLPSDGMMDSTSSSSRSPSPASDVSTAHETKKTKTKTKKSINSQRGHSFGICNTIIKSLEARREREEMLSINQQNIITKLDQTLTAMNQVLEKINDKLYRV